MGIIGVIGVILIVVAFIFGIIAVIYMSKDKLDLALFSVLLSLLLVVVGTLSILTYDAYRNEKEYDEYVTIVTSDCKVLDQSQMYITNGDTVIHKRYVIKYKK